MSAAYPKRLRLLGLVAVLLFGILVARWFAGWGLVTIHAKDVPLGKVIASISRQAHVQVETSIDQTTPVSLNVDRVQVSDAIDQLAAKIDATWRVVYLAAPTRAALNEGVITLRATGKLDDWTTYYYPGPPFGGVFGSGAVDPRYLEVKIEGPAKDLSKLLDEAAQKSGVMAALPKDWAPVIQNLPNPNQAHRTILSLVKSAHGKTAELFLLTDRARWEGRPPGEGPPGGGSAEGGAPPPMGASAALNPDWMEQRQVAQIAKLPPDQQADAKKDMDDRKALFAQLMKLSPEERRAKLTEIMSNPDTVQRMMDQQLLRQANQSADKRINRSVNYLSHKAEIQASQTSGSAPMPGR